MLNQYQSENCKHSNINCWAPWTSFIPTNRQEFSPHLDLFFSYSGKLWLTSQLGFVAHASLVLLLFSSKRRYCASPLITKKLPVTELVSVFTDWDEGWAFSEKSSWKRYMITQQSTKPRFAGVDVLSLRADGKKQKPWLMIARVMDVAHLLSFALTCN